jgi:hypothetical protein
MIDRQHGKIIFECETCDTTLETGTGDFETAREKFREENWKVVATQKIGQKPTYQHYCPACKGGQ